MTNDKKKQIFNKNLHEVLERTATNSGMSFTAIAHGFKYIRKDMSSPCPVSIDKWTAKSSAVKELS